MECIATVERLPILELLTVVTYIINLSFYFQKKIGTQSFHNKLNVLGGCLEIGASEYFLYNCTLNSL